MNEMSSRDLQSLEILLDDLFTKEQLHNLLKVYWESNKKIIKLSGSKDDLIESCLNAIKNNIITFETIMQLIQDAEEYGNQYIYIYKAYDDANTKLNNGDLVKEKLFSDNEYNSFPKLVGNPSGIEWADFRYPNKGIENTWVAKMYDIIEKYYYQKDETDGNFLTKIYKKRSERVAYIINWNGSKNTLEYKITRSVNFDKNGKINSRVNINTKMIDVYDVNKDFKVVDLKEAITKILKDANNTKVFSVKRTTLIDKLDGVTTIRPHNMDKETVFSSPLNTNTIDNFINDGGQGSGVVMTFLKSGSNDELSSNINVYLGIDAVNEIVISSKISLKEYNYVRRNIAKYL